MNTIQYDAQADSINVEDIATNDNNRIVLSRIKRNTEENDILWIQNVHENDGEDCVDYVPEGANDMGWLGYFIGKNNHVKELYFRDFDNLSIDTIKPFIRGVNRNKSITYLDFGSMNLLNGKIFTMLGPLFENSQTLAELTIGYCHLGDDGWRLLALALGSNKHKSLESIVIARNNIPDEALVDIITSMSIHPQLQHIDLADNHLNTNGCKSLATLLQNSATELHYLNLGNNEIDDEGIDTLVPALKNCHQLQTLKLTSTRNESITNRGWQQLANIFESPNSNLTTLRLVENGNNIDDEIAAAFVDALKNNRRLKYLYIGNMSNNIQASLSKILCDTSSINSTFQSNHTLEYLGPANRNLLQPLFALNRRYNDKKEVAIIKILQHHNDFDMLPFFEWEFKVLPLIVNWLERASTIEIPRRGFEPNIGPRKLSSIYQFIRGMPLLYIETRLRQELEEIKVARAQMEERER